MLENLRGSDIAPPGPYNIALRIQRTPHALEFCVQVLVRGKGEYEHLGIGIRDADGRSHLEFTNAEGMATFRPSEPLNWDNAVIVVVIPLLTISMKEPQTGAEEWNLPQARVRWSENLKAVHLELVGTLGEEANHAMAIFTDGGMILKDLHNGKVEFDVSEIPIHMIKLFG